MASLFILMVLSVFLAAESTSPIRTACDDPNEVYKVKTHDCQKYCKSLGTKSDGVGVCAPTSGCFCKPGYRRNELGKCVKECDCYPPKCKKCNNPNEWWDSCTWTNAKAPCPPQDCARIYSKYDCRNVSWPCVPTCRCKGDLVRLNGKCVPIEACSCNKTTEVYKENTNDCQKYCKTLGAKSDGDGVGACAPSSACFCKPGYRRNEDEECIKESDCPKACPPNEILDPCPDYCPKEECSSKEPDFKCPKLPAIPLPCPKPRCVCIEGYLRNDYGVCVPEDMCPGEPPECGPNKSYSDCGSNSPDSCANLDDPDRECSDECVEGCFCDEGYVLNERGDCVTRDKCGVNQQCGKNEIGKDCSRSCPPQTCAARLALYKCVANPPCIPGCDCKPGYLRNAAGDCIPSSRCDDNPNQNCGKNEVFYHCLPCPRRTCNSRMQGKCPDNLPCKSGCDCESGYLSNDAGVCIPAHRCDDKPPKECGIMEEWNDCGTMCERTCKTKDDIIRCQAVCKAGCFCLPEYVRDDSGRCVLKDHCVERTNCSRKNHEVYKKCGSACPPTCSSFNNDRPCTRQCVRGCFCEEGYVRDEDGRCVKPEDCNPRIHCDHKKHEILLKCGSACPDDCNNYGQGVGCGAGCVEGCFCQQGYLRNPAGDCVKPGQCPGSEKCKVNEIWVKCAQGCPPEECARIFTTYLCVDPPPPCKPGCNCLNGYLRDNTGKCVPIDQCFNAETVCGENEEYNSCGTSCPKNCDNKDDDSMGCPPVCVSGCFCKKGYIRNGKECIKPEQCPQRCGPYEVFAPCRYICPPQTCEAPYTDYACPDPVPCEPGCNCVENYTRDASGVCIRADQCPIRGEPSNKCNAANNEEYQECGSACPDTCENGGKPGICTLQCVPGCFCKKGYLRRKDGRCVLPCDCPPKPCQGKNEVYKDCGTACPKTCKNKDAQIKCIALCKKGCFCIDGYVRNDQGECVKPEHCPKQCGENEVFKTCGTACPLSCDKPEPWGCTKNCVTGCFCRDGLVRDANNKCIPKEKCPKRCKDPHSIPGCQDCRETCEFYRYPFKRPKCPADKDCHKKCKCAPGYVLDEEIGGKCVVPERCSNINCGPDQMYSSCAWNCSSWDYCPVGDAPRRRCSPPFICHGGCVCRPGYLIDRKTGRCIPAKKCPVQKCKRPNEEWNGCDRPWWESDDCKKKDNSDNLLHKDCYPKCVCKKNYCRNEKGICVRKCRCPPKRCPKKNEEYNECGTSCPKTCKNKDLLLNCLAVCVKGCFCIKGYVRNDHGECVKPEDCPNKCPVNEWWDSCPPGAKEPCPPQTCQRIHMRINCESDEWRNRNCTQQCRCNGDLVRNDKNECVPIGECSKPTCPVNEVYFECVAGQCGPKKCSHIAHPPGCPRVIPPCPGGCLCIQGYLRSDNGTCIPEGQCPNACPRDHERYVNCVIGFCIAKTCKDIGQPIACPDIIGPCQGGCICEEKYLRNDKGICIPEEQCPGCPPHSHYTSCKKYCVVEYCKQRDNPPVCIPEHECQAGCECDEGYLKDDDGNCVICPENGCGGDENAITGCGNHCGQSCDVNEPCSKFCLIGGCDCKKGFLYDHRTKKCVLPEDCTESTCPDDPNSTPGCQDCRKTCESVWNPPRRPLPDCPSVQGCEDQCKCKPGYVKDEVKGICVRPEDCSNYGCGPNQRFDECAFNCTRKDYCPVDHTKPKDCSPPFVCNPGCVCKKGYLIDNYSQKCILASECPQVPECGPNEVIDPCASPCRDESCKNKDKPIKPCGIRIRCPNPKCVCKEHYCRNEKKQCVPSSKPQCKENEEYFDCMLGECRWKFCSDIGKPIACPGILYPCEGGCLCKEGYLKRDDGECIPQDKCNHTCSDPNSEPGCQSCAGTCSYLEHGANLKCASKPCEDNDCKCKEGFWKDESKGICVRPQECSNFNCTYPKAFARCAFNCESDFCPKGDQPAPFCSPPYVCNAGCKCRFDHRIDRATGECILSENCHKKCPDNEVWVKCIQALCPPLLCSDLDKPANCPPARSPCTGGCTCKQGYLRNKKGVCIPQEDCGCKGDPNAIRKKCPNYCPPTCDNPNPTGPCPKICLEEGCECKKGFVLNKKIGLCVTVDKCPAPKGCKGDPNAVPGRGNHCGRSCSDYKTPTKCPKFWVLGACDCREGYVYDDVMTKKCVLPSDCPCPNNETYSDAYWSCPPRTCDAHKKKFYCKLQTKENALKGCVCLPGYLRDSNGTCINQKDCPKQCPANETYSDCFHQCPSQKCDDADKIYPCPVQNKENCQQGCVCLEGYFRDANGRCIRKEDCPKPVCPANEVYSSCAASQCTPRTCAEVGGPILCPSVALPCPGGCVCRDGWVRNGENICVPPEQCPNSGCPPGEVYNSCGSACIATCANRGDPGMCTDGCVAGCFCPVGMYRNDDNKCVNYEDCTCNNDPNTRPGCGIRCGNTCADHSKNAMRLCPPAACNLFGCDCREGFVYDELTDKCVRPEDCSHPCPANQTYARCAMRCPTDYCPKNAGPFPICDPPRPCPGGCVCKQGYKLDSNSKERRCIHISECPPVTCKKENEVFSFCPPLCHDETCKGKDNPKQDCGTGCGRMRCICKPGYYRNDKGVCIPEKLCPTQCPANETYNQCVYNCPPRTCEARDRSFACPKPTCSPGCQCNEGYLRNNNNVCVLEKDCPGKTCPAGEVYEECGTPCPGTCANGGRPTACTDRLCAPGCFCADGKVRDDNGKCVKLEDCPGCGGDPNAEPVKCVDPCASTCQYPNQTPCPIADCKEGCQCKKGFVKGPDKKCIRLKDCPVCRDNTTYSDCAFFCPTNYCRKDDRPVPQCRPPPPQYCNGGCKCLPGYLRDPDSVILRCVKSSDCKPITCTRKNEIYSSCPSPCLNELCSGQNTPQSQCDSDECDTARCVCKPGHLRNDNGDCVPAEDCSKTCPAGEVYKECGSACPGTCANVGRPMACTDQCVAGCFCPDGQVRDNNGRCVKLEECPGCGDDPNAILVKCRDLCAPTCGYPNRTACPRECDEPGCQCREGFVKGPDKKCIKHEACPVCAENQTYVDCAWFCPSFSDCPRTDGPVPQCMPPPLEYCNGGCICKSGYKRDRDSKTLRCIKASDCPPIKCTRKNEVFSSCPHPCLDEHCSKKLSPQLQCDATGCSHPRCICRKGYLRNDKGECIPAAECPQKCPAGEVYQKCGTACPGTCANVGLQIACTEQCVEGCFCPHGQVRDSNGRCIKLEECPGCRGDPNAYLTKCPDSCAPTCQYPDRKPCPRDCDELGCQCREGFVKGPDKKCIKLENCPKCDTNQTYVDCVFVCDPPDYCPLNDQPPMVACGAPALDSCNGGCACNPGYKIQRYTKKLRCIKSSDCPEFECTRKNEIFESCPSHCLSELCSQKDTPQPLCESIGCADPRCVCVPGNFRNDKGECVPAGDCPPPTCPTNETYGCVDVCPPRTCAGRGREYDCAYPACTPGCQCIKGYLRNSDGVCVMEKDCPPECPINEVYTECDHECPPNTCAAIFRQYRCPEQKCIKRCRCMNGYSRDERGACIPSHQCPNAKCRGENEIFADCKVECPIARCPTDDEPTPECSPPEFCRPGCVCAFNHRRDLNGKCIPAYECPPVNCTRQNEVYDSCPYACLLEHCSDKDNQPTRCDTFAPVTCMPRCICAKNHFRDDNGLCVPYHQCPKPCADPNAELVNYPPPCPGTCDHPEPFPCKKASVKIGCHCKKGYVIGPKGNCIKLSDCPDRCCKDPNAELVNCPHPCPGTCDHPEPFPCKKACVKIGCQCKKGYVIGPKGNCIKLSDCPGRRCKDPNAELVNCPHPCPGTCDHPEPFPCKKACVKIGCQCKKGYVIGPKGNCIKLSDCPGRRCKDPNAELVYCPHPCPGTCFHPAPIPCKRACVKIGCQCKKGYVVGPKGNCIKLSDCPDCDDAPPVDNDAGSAAVEAEEAAANE